MMKRWKWNWGTALALVLGVFIITMGFTLYRASQHRWDLVTHDYYEQELAYQQVIDGRTQAAKLAKRATISLQDGRVRLQLPEALAGKEAWVQIQWYCVQDERKDFTETLQDWSVSPLYWPQERMGSGRWQAKVQLRVEGTHYYFDPQISLP